MPLIQPARQTLSTDTGAGALASWPIDATMRNLALSIQSGLTGTVTFQASIDGGQTWQAIGMTIPAGTIATTTTTNGLFTVVNSGFSHFRANCTTFSSGAATVSLGFSTH